MEEYTKEEIEKILEKLWPKRYVGVNDDIKDDLLLFALNRNNKEHGYLYGRISTFKKEEVDRVISEMQEYQKNLEEAR